MTDFPRTVRERVEAQGFRGLEDGLLCRINYWLRLSPAICMAWAAVGTALQSATVLWWLVPFAALGALMPGHPFDLLYTFGLRRLVGRPPLPRYPLPRRFACLLATLMLIGAAWSFQTGMPLLGQIFGWSLVAASAREREHGLLHSLLYLWPALRQACIVQADQVSPSPYA
jgi:hypothetical protein